MQISLQDLKLIKQKFHQKEFIPTDSLIDTLSEIIELDKKLLQPIFNTPTLSWSQFLQIIDEQNQTNQDIFDFQMFENPDKLFREYQFKMVKPKKSYLEHLHQLDRIHYFTFRESFLLIVFDDQTIALLHAKDQSLILEFTISMIIEQKQTAPVYHVKSEQPQIKRKNIQQELDFLAKEVNIDPWTLKPISNDPKLQVNRNKRTNSEYQRPKHEQQKGKVIFQEENLRITGIATYQNMIILSTISNELRVYSLEYDQKKQRYLMPEKKAIQLTSFIRHLFIVEHRIKRQHVCIVMLDSNLLQVYSLQNFKMMASQKIPTFAECMHASSVLVAASFTGNYCILQDHSKQPISEGLYFVIAQSQVQKQKSIATVDYSCKHQLVLFGSLFGKISLLDLKTNQFVGSIELNHKAILRVFPYDDQNQLIAVQTNGKVTVWDIQRLTQLQEFSTKKLDGVRYDVRQALFVQEKGILYLCSNMIQSWIAGIDQKLVEKRSEIEMKKQDSHDSPLKLSRMSPNFPQ